jgi:hypothetical protein
MKLAIQGVLLFLFIPLVLFLYLRQPLGPAWSIAVGLAIMFGHRFLAAPWMARHGRMRCLWCGRALNTRPPAKPGKVFHVLSGGGEVSVAACGPVHLGGTTRFLTFVARYRAPIAAGIFIPLVVLLGASLALAVGHPVLPREWTAWQFKTIVAFTVVFTSFAYLSMPYSAGTLRSPFPLHNLFLLGIGNTLWVFRLVGAWWLVAGVLQLVRR